MTKNSSEILLEINNFDLQSCNLTLRQHLYYSKVKKIFLIFIHDLYVCASETLV